MDDRLQSSENYQGITTSMLSITKNFKTFAVDTVQLRRRL